MNLGHLLELPHAAKTAAEPGSPRGWRSQKRAWILGLAMVLLLGGAWMLAKLGLHESTAQAGVATLSPDDICLVAPPQAWDSASGLPLLAPRPLPSTARCPVCGMFPARAPRWAAQLIFHNGDTHYFDSPVSLYLYLQAVERFSPGRRASEVAATYVTDYASGAWTPALQAVYVHGSQARGPMRNGNLPAFEDADAARHFAKQHGGELLRAQDITPAMLAALDTRAALAHSGHGT